MGTLIAFGRARARINWGRWLADCPRSDCAGAEELTPRQAMFHCSSCGYLAEIDWPADPDGLWTVLLERPSPQTRNWYPAGHDEAMRAGLPHGQTPADLRDETRQHLEESA